MLFFVLISILNTKIHKKFCNEEGMLKVVTSVIRTSMGDLEDQHKGQSKREFYWKNTVKCGYWCLYLAR